MWATCRSLMTSCRNMSALEDAHVSEMQKTENLLKVKYMFPISHSHAVFRNVRDELITWQSWQLPGTYFLNSFLNSSPTFSWRPNLRLVQTFGHCLKAIWHKPAGLAVISATKPLCWAQAQKNGALVTCGTADAQLVLEAGTCRNCSRMCCPSSALWCSWIGGLFMEVWYNMWVEIYSIFVSSLQPSWL